MSYEFYKVIHLVSIFFFLSTAGSQLMGSNDSKLPKILGGISSLLILVAGMGLLARIGVSHKDGWPAWVTAKMVIWLVLVIMVPVVNKRFSQFAKAAWWVMMALSTAAAYMAVTHA